MSRKLHLVRMCLLDRGAEIIARNVHIRLERRHAFSGPVVDEPPGIVRPVQLVHLRETRVWSFEIRRACVDLRPGHEALVNALLHFEIGVGLEATGGTHCRDSRGKIQPRRGVGNLGDKQSGLPQLSVFTQLHRIGIGVIQVIVHPHQPRNHRIPTAIEHLRTGRRLHEMQPVQSTGSCRWRLRLLDPPSTPRRYHRLRSRD